MADIIDINVLETVEEVTINVVDNVIQVNINKVTNAPITNTSDLINDGEDGVHPYITLLDLPSNLILYPTTVASDVLGYVKLVTDIHDPEYNVTAVNVSTGSITTNSQLISSLITVPNLINGNPGVFNISTIGNIRKTTGSGTAEFYFNIYKRDALGVETLIGVSNPTLPGSSGVYAEFSSTAIWDDGIFTDTDRVVLKFYANRISGGSNPTYEFQFGGLTPVRTLVPIPLSVVPNNGLQSVTGDIVDNTDPLNPIVNIPTLQQVLDIGTSLVGNNNFQGSSAGSGNSGTNNNGFGFAPLVYNTGNHVNAFGYYAGNINTFSGVNLFGKFAYADADNQLVMARYDDVIRARLSYINLTEDRKFQLPDASGTVALTSDIPSPITIDATPTDGSTNAVSSNGVFDALALKQNVLTNPITGTGANGQVSFWNGANSQTGDNGLFWDNTNKRLGIGTTTPDKSLSILFNSTVGGQGATIRNTNANGYAELVFDNNTTPTATGAFVFGYGGTSTTLSNYAYFFQRRNAPIIFGTQDTERMRIFGGGNIAINTTTDAGFRFDVNGTARVQSTLKVGANTTQNASSVLDIESTSKGFLPPRMTTVQKNAIASPVAGLVVYDSTLNKLCVRTASTWETITSL